MKLITLVLCLFSASITFGADKRFKIKNEVNGHSFVIEDGREKLGEMQPEWGLSEREILCNEVIEKEKDRVLSRRTEISETKEEIELCTIKAQYTIVEEDTTAEKVAETQRQTERTTRLEAAKALKEKSSFTNVERDAILKFLLKQALNE